MKKSSLKKRYFSLIELLVVVGIIGILSAIILPALSGASDSAKKTDIKSQLQNVTLACNQYFSDYGHLPNDSGSGTDSSSSLTDVVGALNGGNARGTFYYTGDDVTFEGTPITVYFDYGYDNKVTVSAGNDVNDRVAATSTYGGDTIKSWVK